MNCPWCGHASWHKSYPCEDTGCSEILAYAEEYGFDPDSWDRCDCQHTESDIVQELFRRGDSVDEQPPKG